MEEVKSGRLNIREHCATLKRDQRKEKRLALNSFLKEKKEEIIAKLNEVCLVKKEEIKQLSKKFSRVVKPRVKKVKSVSQENNIAVPIKSEVVIAATQPVFGEINSEEIVVEEINSEVIIAVS